MFIRKLLATAIAVMLILGMTSALAAGELTMEDAKVIALERAQLDAADVFYTQLSQDRDDGREVFEIEFLAGGKEYEYDIDVGTGEIIKESTESVSGRKAELDLSLFLTVEAAMEGALARAGVDAGAAIFTEFEFDFDDGLAQYEVQFTADGQTYEVEMDAQTGEILKYQMKSDNKKK